MSVRKCAHKLPENKQTLTHEETRETQPVKLARRPIFYTRPASKASVFNYLPLKNTWLIWSWTVVFHYFFMRERSVEEKRQAHAGPRVHGDPGHRQHCRETCDGGRAKSFSHAFQQPPPRLSTNYPRPRV